MKGFVTVQFAPGFPFVRSTFDGRCSTPSDWVAHWSGTGKSTLTGPITAFGSDCDRVDLATGKLVYDDGVITEYGKNGDYIFATYTNGRGTLGGTIVDDWTITGGTGRFEGATGQGTEEFILLAPPSFDGKPLPFINPSGRLARLRKEETEVATGGLGQRLRVGLEREQGASALAPICADQQWLEEPQRRGDHERHDSPDVRRLPILSRRACSAALRRRFRGAAASSAADGM